MEEDIFDAFIQHPPQGGAPMQHLEAVPYSPALDRVLVFLEEMRVRLEERGITNMGDIIRLMINAPEEAADVLAENGVSPPRVNLDGTPVIDVIENVHAAEYPPGTIPLEPLPERVVEDRRVSPPPGVSQATDPTTAVTPAEPARKKGDPTQAPRTGGGESSLGEILSGVQVPERPPTQIPPPVAPPAPARLPTDNLSTQALARMGDPRQLLSMLLGRA